MTISTTYRSFDGWEQEPESLITPFANLALSKEENLFKQACIRIQDASTRMREYHNLGDAYLAEYAISQNTDALLRAFEAFSGEYELFMAQDDKKNCVEVDLIKKFIFLAQAFYRLKLESNCYCDELIAVLENAHALLVYAPNDDCRQRLLIHLGTALYLQNNFPQNLNYAIDVHKQAASVVPANFPPVLQALFLHNYADLLRQRNRPQDLEQAITLIPQIIAVSTNPVRVTRLAIDLVVMLIDRDQEGDATIAIDLCDTLLRLPAQDYESTAYLLGLQANALHMRDQRNFNGYPVDVARAVENVQQAIGLHFENNELRDMLYRLITIVIKARNSILKNIPPVQN